MAQRDEAAESPLVLVANDQEWSARSLESILAPNGYAVIRAHTGQQALDQARAQRPDLIILDAQMPDLHGFDVCRMLREDPRFSATTPIIITTSGPSGRAQRLEAYRAGAWEFLGQPVDGEALLLKLRTFVQSKLEVDALRDDTLLDTATGFYNMRGLARRAREIGSEARRRRQPLSCVVFAPDHGTLAEEPAGVTERIGRIFREAGRSSDAVGRLAHGEFAFIAPATGPEGAQRLAERLGGVVEAAAVARDGNGPIQLQAGYCAVPDFGTSDVDAVELLLRATTALRELRESGDAARIREFASRN
jgi:PleD family two-component response regulator